MLAKELLLEVLESHCEGIHTACLQAVLDVAVALERSQNLLLSAMGRCLSGDAQSKHKIKKVDRLRWIRISSAKELWILATNLPQTYRAVQVMLLYSKRMQIEESFRDIKSHQFGLGGRYIRTRCVDRWGVKMLLAAIVQITYWVIGIIGHSQGMQRLFQSNTVRDRKVFSYFTLGKFIIEYDRLKAIQYDERTLFDVIQIELAHS